MSYIRTFLSSYRKETDSNYSNRNDVTVIPFLPCYNILFVCIGKVIILLENLGTIYVL
jgi:hypothetical protein